MVDRYFRGQGRLYQGVRTATGGVGSLRFLNNVTELMVGSNQTYTEHKESYTGSSRIDLRILTQTQVTVQMTLEDTQKDNWAMAFKGTSADVATATVTGEAHDLPAVGNYFALDKKVITSVTSIGAGVAGTDYVATPPSNLIYIPSGSSLAGDANVACAYVAGAAEVITAFTQAEDEFYFYFDGLNTVEGNNPVTVELFKVNLNSAQQLQLISDNLTQMQLTGTVLYDSLNSTDGGFFRITQKKLA
jgi:hypothetical protein